MYIYIKYKVSKGLILRLFFDTTLILVASQLQVFKYINQYFLDFERSCTSWGCKQAVDAL